MRSLSGTFDIGRINLFFVALIAISVVMGIMAGSQARFSLKIMLYTIVLLNTLMLAYLFLLKNMTYGLILYFYSLVFLNIYWRIILPGTMPDFDIPRVIFIFVWVAFLLEIALGNRRLLPRTRVEAIMLFLVVVVTVSMINYGIPRIRLLLKVYAIPFSLYMMCKNVYVRKKEVRTLIRFLAIPLSFYFPMNMLFERFGMRQLVFPRYIMDPNVAGSRFFGERPVGPFLQPVATGFAMVCMFLLSMYALSKFRGLLPKLASVILCIITPAGIFVTYTRSVYLGFFIPIVILAVFGKRLRKYAILLMVATVLAVLGNWGRVTSEDRTSGGLATQVTAINRLVLLEVSLRMFADHPFVGVGFDQYAANRLPYVRQVRSTILGVRSSEMGKSVKQHNQFLLVLTELGMLGFVPLCLIYYLVIRMLWRARKVMCDMYDYEFVVVVWGILASYLANSMFMNPSFFEFMNALPMAMAGIVAGGYQRATIGGWNNRG